MESSQDKYIREHSTVTCDALQWLEKQTHIRTNYPQMLSGAVQGEFLKILVQFSGAKRILEIGTFTGYSAICMALGLPEGGHIDTLELNDELEDLIREGWDRAGVSGKVTLHLGDAREILKGLQGGYDLVYIDANKREYCDYYELALPLLRPGGLILADDVCLGGKVWSNPPASDPQTSGLLAFNARAAADPRVENVILPIRDGLSIIRKK